MPFYGCSDVIIKANHPCMTDLKILLAKPMNEAGTTQLRIIWAQKDTIALQTDSWFSQHAHIEFQICYYCSHVFFKPKYKILRYLERDMLLNSICISFMFSLIFLNVSFYFVCLTIVIGFTEKQKRECSFNTQTEYALQIKSLTNIPTFCSYLHVKILLYFSVFKYCGLHRIWSSLPLSIVTLKCSRAPEQLSVEVLQYHLPIFL